jgi:hypothetical protein
VSLPFPSPLAGSCEGFFPAGFDAALVPKGSLKLQRDKLKQYQKKVCHVVSLCRLVQVEGSQPQLTSRSLPFIQIEHVLQRERQIAMESLASGNKVSRS